MVHMQSSHRRKNGAHLLAGLLGSWPQQHVAVHMSHLQCSVPAICTGALHALLWLSLCRQMDAAAAAAAAAAVLLLHSLHNQDSHDSRHGSTLTCWPVGRYVVALTVALGGNMPAR